MLYYIHRVMLDNFLLLLSVPANVHLILTKTQYINGRTEAGEGPNDVVSELLRTSYCKIEVIHYTLSQILQLLLMGMYPKQTVHDEALQRDHVTNDLLPHPCQ